MNASLEGITKIVYVGSIPFDRTEEQVIELFRSAGPVANFKLIFDKETGKSKGYGFVQYHDTESAKSAVRNLNNYLFGGRNLRVDFASYLPGGSNDINPLISQQNAVSGPYSGDGPATSDMNLAGAMGMPGGQSNTPIYDASLPRLPNGIALPPDTDASQAITNIINNFSHDKKRLLLSDFKDLISSNYTMALNLLEGCPQLSFALVQDLLALQLIEPSQVAGLVRQSPASDPRSHARPSHSPGPQGPQSIRSKQPQQQPMGMTPPPSSSVPVPAQPSVQSPSQQHQQPTSQPTEPPKKLSPQDAVMVRQVLDLPDSQLPNLPEDQRQTILLIREKFARGEIYF